ncbi:MAG: helix-turn-helix transcriptional regulator [Devosia sp.]
MADQPHSLTAADLAQLKAGVPSPVERPGTPIRLRTPADIGLLVARKRKELGLTQQDFADMAGVGRRFVSEVESGKPTSELGKVLGLLQSLGYDLNAARR